MRQQSDQKPKSDALDRYLAAERGEADADGADSGGEVAGSGGDAAESGGEAARAADAPAGSARSATDDAVFARCDAVMALTPRLAGLEELAWAFDEARRIARFGNGRNRRTARAARPWYANLWTAWSTAAVLAVALIIATLTRAPLDEPAGAPPAEATQAGSAPPVTNITFAPIVISSDLAQTLAEIQPVVLLANLAAVDSRSLVVLPFDDSRDIDAAPDNGTSADSIYEQVLSQLAAVPGVYVIDPATAAVYADTDLSAEAIAQQLGVRGVVAGNVAAVNGDIRFELSFTDAAANGTSRNETIERPRENLAMLRTDITASVLDALTMVPPQDEFNPLGPLPLDPTGE